MLVLLGIYLLASAWLALYGFNTWLYALLYLRGNKPAPASAPLRAFPRVTVQLPIFNELYVVERLIDAAASLDWPADHLQIQVLDDSDDETVSVVQARAEYHRKRGVRIEHVRRGDRRGYKAGALAYAFPSATGEFITIFDADFVPPKNFLQKMIPHLVSDSSVGLVQARWGHMNSEYSALTHAQSIALDGHFVIEQAVRSQNGWFMNFNGTGGVWRRECIESAGGWRANTLAEDLDLSYRAQMMGWKFLYLNEIACPAELPPQIQAWKRQQFRWAKGSTQCLIQFTGILARERLPLMRRLEGFMHLTGYMAHPLMLTLLFVLVPLTVSQTHFPAALSYLSLASFGPPLLYALAQRNLYPNWRKRMAYFPFLMLLGIGLAFNNTLAVLQAFTKRRSTFRRTPKFNVTDAREQWRQKQYALSVGWDAVGESFCGVYALLGVYGAWQTGQGYVVPFLGLYALGFFVTAGLTFWHARPHAPQENDEVEAAATSWPSRG